jgi:hypothetical protein
VGGTGVGVGDEGTGVGVLSIAGVGDANADPFTCTVQALQRLTVMTMRQSRFNKCDPPFTIISKNADFRTFFKQSINIIPCGNKRSKMG